MYPTRLNAEQRRAKCLRMMRWHYHSVDEGIAMILKRAAGFNHENSAFDSSL